MMTLFDAGGFERQRGNVNTPQFDAFERAANEYDAAERQADSRDDGYWSPVPVSHGRSWAR